MSQMAVNAKFLQIFELLLQTLEVAIPSPFASKNDRTWT